MLVRRLRHGFLAGLVVAAAIGGLVVGFSHDTPESVVASTALAHLAIALLTGVTCALLAPNGGVRQSVAAAVLGLIASALFLVVTRSASAGDAARTGRVFLYGAVVFVSLMLGMRVAPREHEQEHQRDASPDLL